MEINDLMLEEKAQAYYNECCELGYKGDQLLFTKEDYKAGYRQCLMDIENNETTQA